MGDSGFLDLIVRDRRTRSVLFAEGFDAGQATTLELIGWLRLQPEPSGPVAAYEVALPIDRQEALAVSLVEAADRPVYVALYGDQLTGMELVNYSVSRPEDSPTEVHSGLARADDGEADVWAISDPLPVAAFIVLGACAVIHATDLWFIHEQLKGYRERGVRIRWRLVTSFTSAITCRFEVEVEELDSQGQVTGTARYKVGGKKKKTRK